MALGVHGSGALRVSLRGVGLASFVDALALRQSDASALSFPSCLLFDFGNAEQDSRQHLADSPVEVNLLRDADDPQSLPAISYGTFSGEQVRNLLHGGAPDLCGVVPACGFAIFAATQNNRPYDGIPREAPETGIAVYGFRPLVL
jgi:hypothetical protein